MKTALALAFGAALLPASAEAHTTLVATDAVVGEPFKAVFAVPHGCDGAATTEVRVRLPEGFVGAQPVPKAGWTLAITRGPFARAYDLHGGEVSSGPVEIAWSGGRLEDAWYDEFVVRGTFAEVPKAGPAAFAVTQVCDNGASVAWDEVPTAGTDPHAQKHPAPTVVVTAAADSDHAHHDMDAMGGATGGAMGGTMEPAPAVHGAHEASADHGAGAPGAAASGPIAIRGGFARAMLPGQKVGGAYLTIENTGAKADRLLSVSSPAGTAELHEMTMKGDVMTMRALEGGIEIPAGGTVSLKPGSTHLMFTGVATPFQEGAGVPVTLTFETAGAVSVVLPVAAPGAKAAPMPSHEHAEP